MKRYRKISCQVYLVIQQVNIKKVDKFLQNNWLTRTYSNYIWFKSKQSTSPPFKSVFCSQYIIDRENASQDNSKNQSLAALVRTLGKIGWPTVQQANPDTKKATKLIHQPLPPSHSEMSLEAIPDILKNAAYARYSNSKGHNLIFTIPLVK